MGLRSQTLKGLLSIGRKSEPSGLLSRYSSVSGTSSIPGLGVPWFQRCCCAFLQELRETDTRGNKILYLGIAANYHDNGKVQLALVFHDATYLVDTLEKEVDLDGNCGTNRPGSVDKVANVVIDALEEYEHANYVKVIGAGVSTILRENSPRLCPRLWFELDVVPVIIPQEQLKHTTCFWDISTVDEQAESLARMCMM